MQLNLEMAPLLQHDESRTALNEELRGAGSSIRIVVLSASDCRLFDAGYTVRINDSSVL
jgi:hypothetical protein